VEAISLSILVGTSVDYCVHLVEGYIMAGNAIPNLSTSKVCLNLHYGYLTRSLSKQSEALLIDLFCSEFM